jgi:hypothetical protein
MGSGWLKVIRLTGGTNDMKNFSSSGQGKTL